MEFYKLVKEVLEENSMAGGAGSVFGPAVSNTATAASGDNYAKGDARNLWGNTFPGVMTRRGLIKKKKRSKKKRAYKKRSY